MKRWLFTAVLKRRVVLRSEDLGAVVRALIDARRAAGLQHEGHVKAEVFA